MTERPTNGGDVPEPLVPAEVDLRGLDYMPLYIDRLRKSDTWLDAGTDAFVAYAAMNLWLESWHQVPAGSLSQSPLGAQRASGCSPKVWRRIADRVLAGWVGPCTDGRIYHPVVAEIALEVWHSKGLQKRRTEAARAAVIANRRARGGDVGDRVSHRPNGPSVTESGTARKYKDSSFSREKEGDRESVTDREPAAVSREATEVNGHDASSATVDPKRDLYRRGKDVLGETAGGMITKLLAAKGGSIPAARAALELASASTNAREYIGGIIRGRRADDESRYTMDI